MAKVKPLKFFKRKREEQPKKEKKQVNSPSISRFIPASQAIVQKLRIARINIGRKFLFFAFLLFSVLFSITLASVQAYTHFRQQQQVIGERQEILLKKAYWQKIVKEYKGYRDGYFQLALLEYQLKNKEKAKVYLQEALKLDPNFEEGRKLEQLLK